MPIIENPIYLIFLVLVLLLLSIFWINRLRLKKFLRSASIKERILWALSSERAHEFAKLERGLAYEYCVGCRLAKEGYEVDFNGIKKGRNDGGIDIIAARKVRLEGGEFGTELALVQCKNYYDTSELSQDYVRKFLGDCYVYLSWRKQLAHPKVRIRHIFATSRALESGGSIERYERFCRQNRNFALECLVIEFDENVLQSSEYQELAYNVYASEYAAELEAINAFIK